MCFCKDDLRGKVSFLSHLIKGACDQHDTSLVMLTLITWPRSCFRFQPFWWVWNGILFNLHFPNDIGCSVSFICLFVATLKKYVRCSYLEIEFSIDFFQQNIVNLFITCFNFFINVIFKHLKNSSNLLVFTIPIVNEISLMAFIQLLSSCLRIAPLIYGSYVIAVARNCRKMLNKNDES